jgi:hypothetical protein
MIMYLTDLPFNSITMGVDRRTRPTSTPNIPICFDLAVRESIEYLRVQGANKV